MHKRIEAIFRDDKNGRMVTLKVESQEDETMEDLRRMMMAVIDQAPSEMNLLHMRTVDVPRSRDDLIRGMESIGDT